MDEPNMLQQSLMMAGATAFVAISVKTGNELSQSLNDQTPNCSSHSSYPDRLKLPLVP